MFAMIISSNIFSSHSLSFYSEIPIMPVLVCFMTLSHFLGLYSFQLLLPVCPKRE
jgi:hypothetical protein